MQAVTAPPPDFSLPQTVIPSPNKFFPPTWLASTPHDNYCFREISLRPRKTIGFIDFLPNVPFVIFGRDLAASHIFVGHPSVSGQHAVALWSNDDKLCHIIDLESANGTFLNGELISHSERVELRPGVEILFGKSAHAFIFEQKGTIVPTPPRPDAPSPAGALPPPSQPLPRDMPPLNRSPRSLAPLDRPLPDYDRRPHPPVVPRPEFDRRGPPPPDLDRRGPPPPDLGRRGPPPQDLDRRPMPPPNYDYDRRNGPPDRDFDRLHAPPLQDPDFDRRRDFDRPQYDDRRSPARPLPAPRRHFDNRGEFGGGGGGGDPPPRGPPPRRYDDRRASPGISPRYGGRGDGFERGRGGEERYNDRRGRGGRGPEGY